MQAASRRQFTGTLLTLGAASSAPMLAAAQGSGDFWALLRRGGCVVLMRHALTEPGIGDPPGFRLDQCSTQRQLSETGREQARRVGAAFAREAVRLDEVRSSAWCRCTETAEIAFGRHAVWPPINSFFNDATGPARTREVLQSVRGLAAPKNLMLVTHQVNISALTGTFLAMGEVLITRPGAGDRLPVLARRVF
ncbi:histidine phosphatase family protein [Hydrogenophaga sp.]|jgi:broad specificity phosphatase PhoE|uniref:histidine phosphatase family protein n=1 Tax=Hydrogenophaga sp. TaxID=1904254 RepID=UPI0027236208|nr:histidine phosphatase family protein [Hydrogenophaga sp.]MDO9251738.1 histidine phosphatase family protein [Hydrogenophaga sp.]MDP3325848.1 histidine phosphatase family protein [Hydrogenophaga sp.]MDP3888020.1 histidine phosphatase family protein [Hydrogenophaga sp.]